MKEVTLIMVIIKLCDCINLNFNFSKSTDGLLLNNIFFFFFYMCKNYLY